jgi:hypothetical protein
MPLPKGIPTLKSFATGNYTRTDNVFCSASLMPAYICDTEPGLHPVQTDHIPVIQILDIEATVIEHVPDVSQDWPEFCKRLQAELEKLERHEQYESVEEVEAAIQPLEEAVQRVIRLQVKDLNPSPHWKRWYTEALDTM